MAWQAIVRGANGIFFFPDYKSDPLGWLGSMTMEQKWDNLMQLAAEIASFAPVLLSDMGAAPTPAVTSGHHSNVSWLSTRAHWWSSDAKDTNDSYYLFA